MAHVTNQSETRGQFDTVQQSNDLGPLDDDGAPYWAKGDAQVRVLSDVLSINPTFAIGAIPDSLVGCTNWQY